MVKLNLKEQDVYETSKKALELGVKMRIVGAEIILEGENEEKVVQALKKTPKKELHIKSKLEPETLSEMKARKVFRGGIYWVDFGTDIVGSEQGKRRLAVVIQNDVGNFYSPTTIVVPLTGVYKKKLPTHLSFKINPETMEFFNLREYWNITNTALAEQIRTVDKERIGCCIGKLNKTLMAELEEKIKSSLGLK